MRKIPIVLLSVIMLICLLVPISIVLANGATSGNGITPTVITGSSNPPDPAGYIGLKVSDTGWPGNGTYTNGTLTITISNAGTNHFDWESNIPVSIVYVKTGNDGTNVYNYGLAGSNGDTGLTPPPASNGGELYNGVKYKSISHATFYYVTVSTLLPELPAGALLAIGLAGIGGIVWFTRRSRAVAIK